MLVAVAVVGAASYYWAGTLGSDVGIQRPEFQSFELAGGVPDHSPKPAPNGFIVDPTGDVRINPPMPPEKPMDVHTSANVVADFAIRSCFWPGPRARSGVFTNDGNSLAFENQLPDTGTTYMPTAFQLPVGAKLVLRGEFPHMRHWNLNTYNAAGEPQDALTDVDIEPDAGSFNPFRDGVKRNVENRRYTVTIESGAPATLRPPNTLYTSVEPGVQAYVWMRNYVPDGTTNYLGGVALPEIELHLADKSVLTGRAACTATASPMRGKQLPRTVQPKLWLALTHLPWIDGANVGAKPFTSVPLEPFFNRQQVLYTLFAPWLASATPELRGGWWSNKATRYGYMYLSRNFGKVYVLTGKMPRTPNTWHGDLDNNNAGIDMRYMSVCTTSSPAAGVTTDCAYDEQLLPTLDDAGRFYIVISRGEDRPSNAKLECGVVWLDMGNGDGLVGGSPEFAAIINRHTLVNPAFGHSWFAVKQQGTERQVMGDYLPYVINLKERDAFEKLGCAVDKRALTGMIR